MKEKRGGEQMAYALRPRRKKLYPRADSKGHIADRRKIYQQIFVFRDKPKKRDFILKNLLIRVVYVVYHSKWKCVTIASLPS